MLVWPCLITAILPMLSNPTSKYSLRGYTLSSHSVWMGVIGLIAGLACEHDKRSKCQQLEEDHKSQGPEGPSTAVERV